MLASQLAFFVLSFIHFLLGHMLEDCAQSSAFGPPTFNALQRLQWEAMGSARTLVAAVAPSARLGP